MRSLAAGPARLGPLRATLRATLPAALAAARLALPLASPLGGAFAALACAPVRAQPPAAAPAPQASPAPPSASELRQRAFAAENAQRFGEAADAFVALARGEPDRVDWIVAAGRCLGMARRYREAIDLLDAAHRRLPGALDVTAMLARTLLMQAEGDRGVIDPRVLWADAAQFAATVLATDPTHEESRLVLAQARYLLGDWDEAVAQAEEAARRHPQRAGAHVLLGRIAGDRFRALLREQAETRPTGQEAADLVGRIDAQRRLAQQSYRRAAELDPKKPHPHAALGQLAWIDRKFDAARAHFGDALAVDPDAPVDHDGMWSGVDWQTRAAFYETVRKRYAAGTDALPSHAATLEFHEGRARFDGGQWADASALFDRALANNPAATNNHYYLFLCAYHAGEHDRAERHAAAYAAAGAPAFADVMRSLVGDRRAEVAAIVQFLADRAFAQHRVPASRDLNHVIACYKDSADAWNNHAFLCRETGRFDDALASYQHALEKEPDSPQLLNDCAVILQYHLPSEGNVQKARAMYERALQLAARQLADERVQGPERDRAQQAKRDAEANLRALAR